MRTVAFNLSLMHSWSFFEIGGIVYFKFIDDNTIKGRVQINKQNNLCCCCDIMLAGKRQILRSEKKKQRQLPSINFKT